MRIITFWEAQCTTRKTSAKSFLPTHARLQAPPDTPGDLEILNGHSGQIRDDNLLRRKDHRRFEQRAQLNHGCWIDQPVPNSPAGLAMVDTLRDRIRNNAA